MSYIFTTPSSLQRMVAVKIVAELWNQRDVRIEIVQLAYPSRQVEDGEDQSAHHLEKWKQMTNKVFEKVSALPAPQPLKHFVRSLVRPIGLEILKWWHYHNFANTDRILRYSEPFCWTPRGTVDTKRTAEKIVKDKGLDVETRYTLACVYCLKVEIHALWKTDRRQVDIFNRIEELAVFRFMSYYNDPYKSNLVKFWTNAMRGGERDGLNNMLRRRGSQGRSVNQLAFQWATYDGNLVASEYFLKKLSGEEKDDVLVTDALRVLHYRSNRTFAFVHNANVNVLCFLLNQMSEEQLEQVFENNLCHVLRCLFDWPWQGFVVDTVKRWWRFMSANKWLTLISIHLLDGLKGCNNFDRELFLELWQLCPIDYKPNILEQQGYSLSLALFDSQEEELARVVLKEATADQLKELIYSDEGKCPRPIHRENWDYLKFLLKEDFISEEAVAKCKLNVSQRYSMGEFDNELKSKYDKFFQLANKHFLERKSKKRIEFDDNYATKKSRNW